MSTIAAIGFVIAISFLVIFQLALTLGAPLGRFAWGGRHERVLPTGLRIASAVSILIYALLATVILDRAGLMSLYTAEFSAILAWVVFGYLVLGVLMNTISRSKSERNVMTPLALLLAVLALIVALIGPDQRTFDGMVLESGNGPVFCTLILESYPPQCGDPVHVENWNWDDVQYDEEGSVRWGEYSFIGTQAHGVITVHENGIQ